MLFISTEITISLENHTIFVVVRCRSSLQWRQNERNGVSNHRRIDCLLNRLFRIHRWAVDSLLKGPVTQKKFPLDDVIMVYPYLSGSTRKHLENHTMPVKQPWWIWANNPGGLMETGVHREIYCNLHHVLANTPLSILRSFCLFRTYPNYEKRQDTLY